MSFQALVAREAEGGYKVALERLTDTDLPAGDVMIDVAFSSLNYKDALGVTGKGRIYRSLPIVPGIDLVGTVVESSVGRFDKGDRVIGIAQGLGESEWGGYSERQRVKAETLVPLPRLLSFEQAMQIGTAGFTAMLAVRALEQNGVLPGQRDVVVTGAAGGVGSIATMLLAHRGYRVAASTGRPELERYLRGLGAASIIARDELAKKGGPLQSEKWGGGVDTVGGQTLATLYAQTAYDGAIACCGMAGGHELNTTVWPMILRNVSLLGISSLRTSYELREEAWDLLAHELDMEKLASISTIAPLSRIHEVSEEILAGHIRGRTVIDVHS